MKHISILFVGLSLMICNRPAFSLNGSSNPRVATISQTGTMQFGISSSPELYKLAQNWVKDYQTANPLVQIRLDQVAPGTVAAPGQLRLLPEGTPEVMNNQKNWKMVVGRDVVVPIVNASNPMLKNLQRTGISSEKFAQLLASSGKGAWSDCLPNGEHVSVKLFVADEAVVTSALSEFTKMAISSGNGTKFETATEVIASVAKEPFGIGFCKLSDLRRIVPSAGQEVVLLPIDKNGNGRLDNFENIYENLDEFTHGVWIGKFPNSLSSNVFAVSSVKPTDKGTVAFLAWIVDNGQNSLNSNGYCNLTSNEKESNLASILGTVATGNQDIFKASSPKNWPVWLSVATLIGLFVAIFFYSRRKNGYTVPEQEIQIAPLLVENAIDVPKGLYFDKTHTWAFMEQDGNVRIGIDDFLQHVTGKLTKIRMKEAGETVRKGEKIMTIVREGKQLNIYAPISGTILAHNEILLTDSSSVNSSPFFKGWVYQIEPKNWLREVQFMFMGEKYTEWLRDEFVRLRDFVAASVKTSNLAYAHVILQDGGELTDHVLADLEPKVWEEFQTKFIDTSR